jgi:hypothetical protein
MSGRLVRRVLQEREASPQGPAAAAEDGLVVVEEEEEEEEAASPRRVAARNPFDLLDDDDDDEAANDKVRPSPHRALLVRVYNWIPNCFPGLIAVGHASCARGAMPYLMTDKIGRVQVDAS